MNLADILNKKYDLLSIMGPTASGKTSFAANVAYLLNGEIISADSRQVYKNMDIGTGKDLDDYWVNNEKIPYHLIDIAEAGEKYNLFEFHKDFFKSYFEIKKSGKTVILCGGTGLYVDAIVQNYNLVEVPENIELRKSLENKSLNELSEILSSLKKLHNTSEIDTKKRAIRSIEIEIFYKNNPKKDSEFPKLKSLNIGVGYNRAKQMEKITNRLKIRLENGMIDEVKKLMDKGIDSETLIYYGLEYKYVTLYLLNQITYNELFEKLNIAIHQFSKRQMTWFRKMERQGVEINWIDGELSMEEKLKKLEDIIMTK